MIENEVSFCFKHDDTNKIIEYFKNRYGNSHPEVLTIKDFFIDKNRKLRKTNSSVVNGIYELIEKHGDKKSGSREEITTQIPENVFSSLTSKRLFSINKTRTHFMIDKNNSVVVDQYTKPMNIVIVEFESMSPYKINITSQDILDIMGRTNFKTRCPLNSFELFNRRVGFCGAPSSGKSSIAQNLSFILNTQYGANSFHVTEYATTFIQKNDRPPSFEEEFFIWHGQKNREKIAEKQANIVISDCPSFLTYCYALLLPKPEFNQKNAFYLSKIYKRALEGIGDYTDLFLMKLIDYKENGIRYNGKEQSLLIEERIIRFLNDHNVLYKEFNYYDIEKIIKTMFYINEF